jgi:hypothetical protein
MPWGTVLLTALSVWLLATIVLAFAIGQVVRLADDRRPRKSKQRGALRRRRTRV